MSDHIIHVKGDGVLDTTTPAEIDEIVRRGVEQGRIVIHLHGGLVREPRARDTAAHLDGEYLEAGSYPVFFVYETGFLEVLRNNLHEINKEKLFRRLVRKLLKFAVAKALGSGGRSGNTLSLAPDNDVIREHNRAKLEEEPYADLVFADDIEELSEDEEQQFLDELANDERFQEVLQEVANSRLEGAPEELRSRGIVTLTRASSESLMSQEVLDELAEDAANTEGRGVLRGALFLVRVVKILRKVVKRFRMKRDHGVYATVVEETLRSLYLDNAGRVVWGTMKKDTADTFQNVGNEPIRGGWYFVQKLGEALAAADNPVSVSVVAHSLGSVFACNLVEYLAEARADANHPLPNDFKLDKLIFLAPAVTFAHFSATVGQRGDLVEHFRIFNLSDEIEKGYWEIPIVYNRSLLYLVSGFVETEDDGTGAFDRPLVGMERYWIQADVYDQPAVQAARDFLNGDQRDAYYSVVDAGPGRATDAPKHGKFAKNPKTLESIKYFLQE